MVCEWGMSEVLGPVTYGEKEGPVFLGKDLVARKNFSEKIHEVIDEEVRSIISNAYKKAKEILAENIHKLDKIANLLLEKEVLNTEELNVALGKPAKKRFPILDAVGKKAKNA
jgi:cell division protease FtsH